MRRTLIAALIALPVAGCGGTSGDGAKDFQGESKAVAQTIQDLEQAGSRRDGTKICRDLLASALTRQLIEAGSDCRRTVEDSLKDADAYDLEVRDVKVSGTTARAQVRAEAGDRKQDATVALVKERGRWRISDLG